MLAAVPCPTADDLAQFIAGGVAGAQLDTLEAHVDACSGCRQSLAAVVRGQAAQAALGRYRVDGILGAGGMGIVYRAFDPELRRPVAIKVVRPGPEEGMVGLRARLGREAEAMARLSHRNVCHVYDLGSDGDELWIAMELVEGTSMRPWMLAQPGAAAVADVIGQAAEGLGAAHAVGLCHRDVKPDNILVEPGGRAVLTDFGLARQLDVALDEAQHAVELALERAELIGQGATGGPAEGGPRVDQPAGAGRAVHPVHQRQLVHGELVDDAVAKEVALAHRQLAERGGERRLEVRRVRVPQQPAAGVAGRRVGRRAGPARQHQLLERLLAVGGAPQGEGAADSRNSQPRHQRTVAEVGLDARRARAVADQQIDAQALLEVVEFGAALRTAIAPGQRRTSRVALGVAAGAVLAAAAILAPAAPAVAARSA